MNPILTAGLLIVSLMSGAVASNSGPNGGSAAPQTTVHERNIPDDAEWQADKALLQGLLENRDCDKIWKTLWPWAKKENMEARFLIYMLMAPPPDADILYAPGNSGDYATTMRDALVMAVHSFDFEDGSSESKYYKEMKVSLFRSEGGDSAPRWATFLACVKNNNAGCSEIAVKEKLVPSFEDYAAQIDALMKEGMTGSCFVVKRRN